MLVIFGALIFFPLVIGTIVSAISENPLLRCSMYVLAISPLPLLCLIYAIAAKRWDYFFDKDLALSYQMEDGYSHPVKKSNLPT